MTSVSAHEAGMRNGGALKGERSDSALGPPTGSAKIRKRGDRRNHCWLHSLPCNQRCGKGRNGAAWFHRRPKCMPGADAR